MRLPSKICRPTKKRNLFILARKDLELGDEDKVKERETKQEYNLLCDWMIRQLGYEILARLRRLSWLWMLFWRNVP